MSTEIMVGTRWHAFSLFVVLTFVPTYAGETPTFRKERSEEKDQSTKEWIAFHRVPGSYNPDSKQGQPVTGDMNTRARFVTRDGWPTPYGGDSRRAGASTTTENDELAAGTRRPESDQSDDTGPGRTRSHQRRRLEKPSRGAVILIAFDKVTRQPLLVFSECKMERHLHLEILKNERRNQEKSR
jgi:hypothetical protein